MPKREMETLQKQPAQPGSSLVQHRRITENRYPSTATQGFSSSQKYLKKFKQKPIGWTLKFYSGKRLLL